MVGAGNDILEGGQGNDTLNGGDGLDNASYVNTSGAVTVKLELGKTTGAAGTDKLISIENVIGGAGNDLITGDANQNTLEGGAGNDKLDGGDGIDTVTYVHASGLVAVNLGSGLASGAEGSDTLANIENVVGSNFDDTLTGDANSNNLNAGTGNDLLVGGLGDDLLDGRDGEDMATYAMATGAVNVNLATGLATGADGSDYLLGIENLVGSGFADTLAGKDGAIILTGGAGADSFIFNSKIGVDKATDFSSGVDKFFFSQTGIGIGDGDTLVENAVTTTGPGGFSANAELVIVQKNIVGAITTANAAAAIGNADSAYGIGATALFAVDNGTDTDLFLFTSSANDSAVSAVELALIVEAVGVASTTPADYGFIV